MKSKSQIGQDQFVIETLGGKLGGVFLDIGAGHPISINNTYVLEKDYNWSGISIDYGHGQVCQCKGLSDYEYLKLWDDNRNTPLILTDALTVDYKQLFSDHYLPHDIDYLELDIEPPKATLECLYRLPCDDYNFKIITFEHDHYRDDSNRGPAREFLESLGYTYVRSTTPNQEDWYVKL